MNHGEHPHFNLNGIIDQYTLNIYNQLDVGIKHPHVRSNMGPESQ
jgi:hypothetical protein